MDYAKGLNEAVSDELRKTHGGHDDDIQYLNQEHKVVKDLFARHGDVGIAAAWWWWNYAADDDASATGTIQWCANRFVGRYDSLGAYAESKHAASVNQVAADLADHVDWGGFAGRLEDDEKIVTVDDYSCADVYVFDNGERERER